jgi:diaminohydroxyphosphoribosylaminopyrimidine deaminase / 5-amino-6-(5-phosphoribosylamino)uracil reductase
VSVPIAQWSEADNIFMSRAIQAVEDQLEEFGAFPDEGCVVGCVIVSGGEIVGIAATAAGGRPHAEAIALEMAGNKAVGAHVYVTLEPCAHVSTRGPSCASSLVAAGVARVVACLQDPDPRTAGSGFDLLHGAGIVCEIGLMAEVGARLIAPFQRRFEG